MRRNRYSDEQIAMALQQAEVGTPVGGICRKLGITEATFYRWKKRFGSLGVPELRDLRQVRGENRKLKDLVADLSLDKTTLQVSFRKRGVKPAQRRAFVGWAQEAYGVSERRACGLVRSSRSSMRYRSVRPRQEALPARLRGLAAVRVRRAYRQLHTFLRREGWEVNHKRVYRLYSDEGVHCHPQ